MYTAYIFVGGVFFVCFVYFVCFILQCVLSRCTMWPTVRDQYSLLFSLSFISFDCNCVRGWNVRIELDRRHTRYTRIQKHGWSHRKCAHMFFIIINTLALFSIRPCCSLWFRCLQCVINDGKSIRTFLVYVCTRSLLFEFITNDCNVKWHSAYTSSAK